MLKSGPHIATVKALVVKREYKFLSRWFPTHLCVGHTYVVKPQYAAWIVPEDPRLGAIHGGYLSSRSAATRMLANQPSSVYLPRAGRLSRLGNIKSEPLLEVYVPMNLSMAVDLEAFLDSLNPNIKANEMLATLESFFATHVLHDEEVETQKQITSEPVDGFHNEFSNQILSQLVRALTLCLK